MAYAELVSTPLTLQELYRYLWQAPACTYEDFLEVIVGLNPQFQDGFVFFGVPNMIWVEERRRAVVPSERLLRRARRAVRLVAWVPYLRAIFVCNSVGAERATDMSDIDWLVVVEPGRIWFVRFMLNSILRLCGLRTCGGHEAGRVCLSFFVDTEHLDFAALRVVPDDIHFAFWLHQMLPIYDPRNLWRKFLSANQWVIGYVPNFKFGDASLVPEPLLPGNISRCAKRLGEILLRAKSGEWFEKTMERIQRWKLLPSLVEKAGLNDKGVVIASGILKFHERDTRRGIYDAWKKLIDQHIL